MKVKYELYHGDCLNWMPKLKSGSINLIACDLPYFGVKDDAWDNQWATRDDFLAWVGCVCDEWQRLLAPNGSVYAFASPQMAWHVEGVIRERFNVLNQITWTKPNAPGFEGWHKKCSKESLRQWYPMSERIIFAEHQLTFSQIVSDARAKHGLTMKQLTEVAGAYGAVNHGGAVSNWESGANVPTVEHWANMQKSICLPPYDDAIRPFNATPDAPYTDVWTFPTVNTYPGKHPTEKPISLMQHIVNLSSRPGDVVLDCCMGYGTTGVAAGQLGRKFIGIEMDGGYFAEASTRIAAAYGDWDKARKVRKGKETDTLDLPLFA